MTKKTNLKEEVAYLKRVIKAYQDLNLSYRLGIRPKESSLDVIHIYLQYSKEKKND